MSPTAAAKLLKAEQQLYGRVFTNEQRRRLAREGKALPDGSFPMETQADLHPAAQLLRMGEGDVDGATALVHRRARELKAPDPLLDEGVAKADVDTRSFQGRDQESAAELKAMEDARRGETDPVTQKRMDRAIAHARARHHALHHPDRAEPIAKAERDRVGRDVGGGSQARAKAERIAKAEGISLSRAAERVTREHPELVA
ncbi:MAG: hypothetical protein WAU69_03070 [Solirubrobacteraceae bacterium]